jgi:hypothetical protein
MTMRWICVFVAAAVFALQVPGVLAQDGLSSDQLRRMYDDAVVQLKTAQDRRNELARENEKLRSRLIQLESIQKELDKVQRDANITADKTFQARSEHAAFQEFLAANPFIRIQWQAFSGKNLLDAPSCGDPLGVDWPLPDKLRN